jgi:hypothetical protein
MDWMKRGQQTTQSVFTGLVDIFGRPTTPAGQPIVVQREGMSLAGWVAVGVAGVVVLAVVASSLKRSRMAGYRRHRSRRSRR